MPVVGTRVRLGLHARWRILLQTLHRQPLERRQRPRRRLKCVRRGDDVRRRLRDVRRRVRVLQRLLSRVDRPRRDMDLLSHGDVERLEEGIHVLPAVELAETAEVGVDDGQEGVAVAVAVDELLNVCGLDLASVVEDIASGRDEDLREV